MTDQAPVIVADNISDDVSDSVSDSEESDELTLLECAIDWTITWDGSDMQEIGEIAWELGDCFKNMKNKAQEYEVRTGCDVLLARADLPHLYRAQFLVFMATTQLEADGRAMIERLIDAESAVQKGVQMVVEGRVEHDDYGGDYDDRVAMLSAVIQVSANHLALLGIDN
jgi:hypothetical protein